MDKVKLLDLCQISTGKYDANHACNDGKYKFFTCADNSSYCNTYSFEGPCIILPGNGANVGNVYYYDGKFDAYQRTYVLYDIKCNSMYLFRYLKHFWNIRNKNLQYGSATNYIKMGNFENFIVDLPNSETQQKIVDELDCLSDIIEKKKQQLADLDNLIKSQFIEMFGDINNNSLNLPLKRFENICENLDSKRIPITSKDRKNGVYPYYGASGIVDYVDNYIFDEDILLISEDGANLIARSTPIAFSVTGKCWVNNHAHVVRFNNKAMQKYIEYYFNQKDIEQFVTGAAQPKFTQSKLNSILIPIPEENELSNFYEFIESIDKLKLELKQSIEETQNLFNERMQHYFGE